MEARKPGIWDAAAFVKAFDDLIFDTAHHTDVLSEDGHVISTGCSGKRCCIFRRQGKLVGIRIQVDDTPGYHGAQPFANVALVKAGFSSNLNGRGRLKIAHGVKKPRAVAD